MRRWRDAVPSRTAQRGSPTDKLVSPCCPPSLKLRRTPAEAPSPMGKPVAPGVKVGGFTLLEIAVALTVLTLVMTAAAATLASTHEAWRRQWAGTELLQNARWGIELMSNESRHASSATAPSPTRLRIWVDHDNNIATPPRQIEYRRQGATILRQEGAAPAQQLANFVTNNPGGTALFSVLANRVTITLTVTTGGRSLTVRSRLSPRNTP